MSAKKNNHTVLLCLLLLARNNNLYNIFILFSFIEFCRNYCGEFFFYFFSVSMVFLFFLSNTKTPDRMLYLKKCVSGLYIFSAMTATSIALMIHQWELFIFCIFIYIFLLNYWFNRNEYEKVTKLLLMYTSLLDRKIVIYSYMGI